MKNLKILKYKNSAPVCIYERVDDQIKNAKNLWVAYFSKRHLT